MRKGLTRRTIVASGVLAVLVASAFAVLLRAIEVQRDAARSATHSQEVLTAANTLERLLLDLETGRDAARSELPGASDRLVRVAGSDPGQERQARAIATGVESYVQGRQPVEALRREFDHFIAAERALLARR